MDWKAFRDGLVSPHTGDLQTIARLDHGLSLCKEGLALLASEGHLHHLAPGPAPPVGWPRRYYHLQAAPGGHEVFCPEDVEFLGDGWFPSLAEAQHAEGMGFQGRRGGIVPRRGLPAPPPPADLTPLDKEARGLAPWERK